MPPQQPVGGAGAGTTLAPPSIDLRSPRVLRDLAAVTLLVVALVIQWDRGVVGANPWVLLAVLVALVGVIASYVLVASMSGRTLPQDQVALLRAGSVAPLALLLLITLVRGLASDAGIGFGAAMAGAAVILVIVNRADGQVSAEAVPWLAVSAGLYAAAALWILVATLKSVGDSLGSLWVWALVMPLFAVMVMMGWVGVRLSRRSASDWVAGFELTAALVLAFLIVNNTAPGIGVGSSQAMTDPTVGGFLLLAAMAAAASLAPGVHAALLPAMKGPARWILAVVGMITMAIIASVGIVLQSVLVLTLVQSSFGADLSVPTLVTLLVGIVLLAGLIVVRARLLADPRQGRRLAVYFSTAGIVVTLVLVVALPLEMSFLLVLLFFIAPVIVIGLLTVPPDIRAAYGPLLPATGPAASTGTAMPGAAPAGPQGAPPAPRPGAGPPAPPTAGA